MIGDILLWGFVIGAVHFAVVGMLYQNPWVARLYKEAKAHPGVKKWESERSYVACMFAGTQIEVFILTGAYLLLRQHFADPKGIATTLLLSSLFAGIRVYPRFWNMWVQSSYPNRLLAVEFVNGTIGTFIIVLGLRLLPV